MSKNDENFIAFCDEFRTYEKVHHLFPHQATSLQNAIKYTRKKIREGTLEEWKVEQFREIEEMRDMVCFPSG